MPSNEEVEELMTAVALITVYDPITLMMKLNVNELFVLIKGRFSIMV